MERYVWENWSTQEDIDGLGSWVRLFGPEYLALFVFIYHIRPTVMLPDDTPDVWHFRDAMYLLRAVPLEDYRAHMKVRSPKWGTVGLPGTVYRRLARPFRYYSHELPSAHQEATHGPDQAQRLVEVTAHALAAFAAGSTAAWRDRG